MLRPAIWALPESDLIESSYRKRLQFPHCSTDLKLDHAQRMERHVQEGAAAAIDAPWKHGVGITVSGRDISISGTAHDALEKAKILSSLDRVEGHRVVHDNLDLLPVADIYALEATKDEAGLILNGVVAAKPPIWEPKPA